jgi:hypothetical protein
VSCEDHNPTLVEIFPTCLKEGATTSEHYLLNTPKLNVGNLIMGERYIEPSGKITCENQTTGDSCVLDFKSRGGMFSSADTTNAVEGIITDTSGKKRIKLFGKFTTKLEAIDLQTEETWTVFEAPEYPQNSDQMYNMNYWTLQLNLLSEKLQAKLPPTDSRFRPDVRYWESADLESSSFEKARLETNQRERRAQVKKLLQDQKTDKKAKKVDVMDEESFYTPKFFNKAEKGTKKDKKYVYTPKVGEGSLLYWSLRETSNWASLPRIFEDDCEPFY